MSFDYQGLRSTAIRLVDRFGQAATITRPGAGPLTPWDVTAPAAGTTYPITVIDDGIRDFYAAGGALARTARTLTIAATGVVPMTADRITLRGVSHDVVEVRATSPGGVDLAYEVEVSA